MYLENFMKILNINDEKASANLKILSQNRDVIDRMYNYSIHWICSAITVR